MKETYVPIRPGILEHLLRGDISACEFGVYAIIHLQADYGSGIWRGSAARISNTAPRGAELRKIQRALEHLTDLGLLKPFHTQGVRGNYPVLINKFTVRSGALKGQRLNANLTTDWRNPAYESCAEDDAVDAPIQEVRSKKQGGKKKIPAPKPGAPADPRREVFLQFAGKEFEAKHGVKPSWAKADFVQYDSFLKHNTAMSVEEMQRRFRNYLASTEPFIVSQGGSLTYFFKKFVVFARVQIPVLPRKSDRAVLVDPEELRRKRLEITPEGQAILDRTGGVLQ